MEEINLKLDSVGRSKLKVLWRLAFAKPGETGEKGSETKMFKEVKLQGNHNIKSLFNFFSRFLLRMNSMSHCRSISPYDTSCLQAMKPGG